MSPWRSGVAVACVLVALSPRAYADPTESELATARQLFAEGVALEDKHDWTGALERFRRVAAIKQTPQVRYNLGLCLGATGHLVEAENELSPVADLTGDRDTLAVAALARAELTKLRPRIPRLVVTLADGAGGASAKLTLDGQALNPALLGTPMHVDPGPHSVVAARASNPPIETNVVAVEGASEPVVVALALPAPALHRKIPTYAYVTGGVAAATLGTALALGLARLSAVSQLNSECGPNGQYCPSSARGKVDLVDAETIAADVLAGVGVASALATGVIIRFAPMVPASVNARAPSFGATVVGSF